MILRTVSNHETAGLPNDFWLEVADALNNVSADDNSPLQVAISEEGVH